MFYDIYANIFKCMHINFTQIKYNARINVSSTIVLCTKYTFHKMRACAEMSPG